MDGITVEGLRRDHQTAKHFAFLKAHDRGGHTPFIDDVTGWAWVLVELSSGQSIVNHNLEPLAGRCHAAMPLMAVDVIQRVGVAGRLHLVTDLSYFNDMINDGPEVRERCDYKKTNGQPYANAATWQQLDEVATRLSSQLSAGRPRSDYATRCLYEASRHASRAARNVGRKLGDWDL